MDPAPLQVKPISITVFCWIAISATADVADNTFRAAADMIVIAFFFLLRPGVYPGNNKDPFWLEDTQLFIGNRRLPLLSAPKTELRLAQFASLTFTTQKMVSAAKLLGLPVPATPSYVLYRPLSAECYRLVCTRHHLPPPWRVCSTPLTKSLQLSSQHASVRLSRH
jgi:hypothetical protein